jgi:hypothetical protein
MISQKLFNLFSSFSFEQHSLDVLWKKIIQSRDPYAATQLTQIANKSGYFAGEFAPRLQSFQHDSSSFLVGPYVPIQAFRWLESEFQNQPATTRFLSSGTTSTSRSQSFFSPEGLKFYRLTSCFNFFATLEDASGRDFDQYRGISLVPSPIQSPHSSLATMLGWISEFVPVDFVTSQEMAQAVIHKSPYFWVFSTSLQLFDLCEQSNSIPLPPESFVFDTGGNKGRKVRLTEEEKLQKFLEFFSLRPQQLIREYGMCELASQAYAFWPKRSVEATPAEWPNFRFPWWAPVAISKEIKINSSQGRGALIVADSARADLGMPIRTQDDVSLAPDGSFRIHGRLSGAVLKGCSIEFESKTPVAQEPKKAESLISRDSLIQPISEIIQHFYGIISVPEFGRRLAKELRSEKIAASAIQDLLADWPKTAEEWQLALDRSIPRCDGKIMPALSKILFILPANHSVAGIYPIILGMLHQMQLSIRIPAELNTDDSAIGYFLQESLKLAPNLLTVLGPDFQIESDLSVQDFDAIFAVGSTETMSQFRATIGTKAFQAMGSVHTLIWADINTATKNSAGIVKDFLSLGQRGCLSSRLLLIPQYHGDFVEFETVLDQAVCDFGGSNISAETVTQLNESRIEFLLKGAEVRTLKKSSNNLILIDKSEVGSAQRLAPAIAESMAPVSFCFCVMRVGAIKPKELIEELSLLPDRFRVGLDHQWIDGSVGQFQIGHSNHQKWDGCFDQIRLFDFMTHAKPLKLG